MLLTLAAQKRAAGFDSRDMMTCSPKSRETFDVPLTVVAVFARINCGGNSKAAGAVILFVFNSKAAKTEDSNVGRSQEIRPILAIASSSVPQALGTQKGLR